MDSASAQLRRLDFGLKDSPKFFRALGGDAGQQLDEAFEGDFIARVGDEFQICRRVLDVRLLEKPDAAGDGEWDLALGQFELQFERVEMRAVEHGDLVHARAFLAELNHALRNKRGLLRGVHARNQRGFHAGFARRRKNFGELVPVGGDGGVGDLQNFRRAAVIGFDLENFRVGITFWEFEDVFEIRAAPRVNALRVVADDRDVLMPPGQQVNQVALELVRVLIFVHEDELKAALIMFAHVGMVLKQLEPERKQVVEVHRVGSAFAGRVTFPQVGDLHGELREIIVLLIQNFIGGFVRVDCERKNFAEHFGFREMRSFRFNACGGNAGFDQVLRVVAVENREIAAVTEQVGMETQHTGADGVKCAAPKRGNFLSEQIRNAPHHFTGGLVGECQQQDAVGGDALFEQIGDAIGERARLA